MTTTDQAKPSAIEEAKQIINDYAQKCATVDQGNLYFVATQFEAAFTALQAENAKMKEAYGVLREGLLDVTYEGHSSLCQSMKPYRPHYKCHVELAKEALAKAEEVLK